MTLGTMTLGAMTLRTVTLGNVRKVVGLVILLLSLAACGADVPQQLEPQSGGVIYVTTTSDEFNSDYDCSLREALYAAENDVRKSGCVAGSGADTVRLQPGATYTLRNEHAQVSDYDYIHSALPVVNSELTLEGVGATLAGPKTFGSNKDMTLLYLGASAEVTIRDLSVTGGYSRSGAAGLNNRGELVASNINFVNNESERGTAALENSGTLILSRCRFEDNVSDSGTAGLYTWAYSFRDRTELDECIFRGNRTAVEGGYAAAGVAAIKNERGPLSVKRSAIIQNETLRVARSSGVWPRIVYNRGEASFENVTLSENHGPTYNVIDNEGDLELNFVTIFENTSGRATVRALYRGLDSSTHVSNSIIARSGSANYGVCGGVGSLRSRGYNYTDSRSCGFNDVGDTTVSATSRHSLLQLANNGGFTPSHAFNPFLTPRLFQDLGDPYYNRSVTTDQRSAGFVREKSGRVDQGAIEGCTSYGVVWFFIIPLPYCNENELAEGVEVELKLLDDNALARELELNQELFEMAEPPCETCLTYIRADQASLLRLELAQPEKAQLKGLRLYSAEGEVVAEVEGGGLELEVKAGAYFLELMAELEGEHEQSVFAEVQLRALE